MSDERGERGPGAVRSVVFDLAQAPGGGGARAGDPALAATDVALPAPLPSQPALTAPLRYAHVESLGAGGMGRVERLRDRDLLRDVAVKQLREEFRAHAAMVGQFLWEARVTAYLDHPNIVPVYDIGRTADGQLYFSMKLVRGQSLESALARARAEGRAGELPRRLRWFLQLCHAVAYAHARGVLHRDLKPANVMLGEYGEVLVTDWGLALPLPGPAGDALRASMPEGLAELSAGTPMYMSPEQARGEALDARSDVFTLGAILYEMITLRRAFEGSDVGSVLAKVLDAGGATFAGETPGAPRPLIAIVRKAMAPRPEQRYASVHDLANDLETAMDGRTPSADDASMLTRLARFYVGHDPALARLNVIDVDLFVGAGFALGIGVGILSRPSWVGYGWIALAAGVLAALRPMSRWVAFRRAVARERGAGSSEGEGR